MEFKHENDRLRMVVEQKNTADLPLDKIRMKLRFDSKGLRRMDNDKKLVNHILLGSICDSI